MLVRAIRRMEFIVTTRSAERSQFRLARVDVGAIGCRPSSSPNRRGQSRSKTRVRRTRPTTAFSGQDIDLQATLVKRFKSP